MVMKQSIIECPHTGEIGGVMYVLFMSREISAFCCFRELGVFRDPASLIFFLCLKSAGITFTSYQTCIFCRTLGKRQLIEQY